MAVQKYVTATQKKAVHKWRRSGNSSANCWFCPNNRTSASTNYSPFHCHQFHGLLLLLMVLLRKLTSHSCCTYWRQSHHSQIMHCLVSVCLFLMGMPFCTPLLICQKHLVIWHGLFCFLLTVTKCETILYCLTQAMATTLRQQLHLLYVELYCQSGTAIECCYSMYHIWTSAVAESSQNFPWFRSWCFLQTR